jgi:alcohol/geraniol dehydrogenase (NADP+)
MKRRVKAYAATEVGSSLEPFEYDLGDLGEREVDIDITYCGICHSDLSMIDNDWGLSKFPLVPGHEIVGRVAAIGERVTNLKVGQQVGVGWFTKACQGCVPCLSGDQNMCTSSESTIVGRHGGFADKIRVDASWTIPVPEKIDLASAGPLFCGGITVFNPIVQHGVCPTHRVGVVGIGGLGHMAVKFLKAWGCEVTAFTSSESKYQEVKELGAHHVVNSRDPKALDGIAGSLDFILVTVNVGLDWNQYLNALGRRGHLHFVGGVLEPLNVSVFSMLGSQKSISASPLGSPTTVFEMLDFCERHKISPITQQYPLAKVNDAIEDLKGGRARYRLVLKCR